MHPELSGNSVPSFEQFLRKVLVVFLDDSTASLAAPEISRSDRGIQFLDRYLFRQRSIAKGLMGMVRRLHEVVSPLPKAEAAGEFKQWRTLPRNALIFDEDIRLDTIR